MNKTVSKRRVQPRGEHTRERCINHLIRMVAKQGFRGISLESLASDLKTYRSQLAYHFQDLDDIAVAAYKKILETSRGHVTEALDEEGSERLESYVRGNFEWIRKNPGQARARMSFMDYIVHHSELRAAYVEGMVRGQERIRGIVLESFEIPESRRLDFAKGLQWMLLGAWMHLIGSGQLDKIDDVTDTILRVIEAQKVKKKPDRGR